MAEWSDLPTDVLEQITRFLPLPDYHRFSAVCQSWKLAAQNRRYSPAKQLPWLLIQSLSDPQQGGVFSISDNRHYNLAIPELQGQYVCGSSFGWLFTLDRDFNFRLLNPFTGKRYNLPQVPFPYGFHAAVMESDIGEDLCEYFRFYLVYKAILDYDPSQRSDFTVMILSGTCRRRTAFWRPGDPVWTIVDGNYRSFDDIACFKGKFYANDVFSIMRTITSVTYFVDVGPNPKVTQVTSELPLDDNSRTYLVEFRGDLLLLQRVQPLSNKEGHHTRAFFVYKLDLENSTYYQHDHLDGCSIFVGTNSPIVVDPSQFPGCTENCIYFTAHVRYNNIYCFRLDGPDGNGIYDIVKNTISPYHPPDMYNFDKTAVPTWWTPNPW